VSIIAWIVVGITGVHRQPGRQQAGPRVLGDLFLGVLGAVVAGWAFNRLGSSGVNGINL